MTKDCRITFSADSSGSNKQGSLMFLMRKLYMCFFRGRGINMDNFWLPLGHFFYKKENIFQSSNNRWSFQTQSPLSPHPFSQAGTSPSQQAGSLILKVRAFYRIDDRNSIWINWGKRWIYWFIKLERQGCKSRWSDREATFSFLSNICLCFSVAVDLFFSTVKGESNSSLHFQFEKF